MHFTRNPTHGPRRFGKLPYIVSLTGSGPRYDMNDMGAPHLLY